MEGCGNKIGPYDCCTIITGDAKELAPAIPDESVDLIFTDPPYTKSCIPLYDWLAQTTKRVVRPDGFCLVYVGHYWKDDVMALMRPQLEYFWDFTSFNRHNSPIMWTRRIISRAKSILAYRKPGSKALPYFQVVSVWTGSGEDKRFHTFGQDESTARYYTDVFSREGHIVLDPFCGGGTGPAMSSILNRHYLAFEIDPEVAERARERVRNTQPPLFVMQPEQMEMKTWR